MISLGEMSHRPQDTLPNLGDVPLDAQRNRLRDIYASQSLIDPSDPSFVTDNPRADIGNMRHIALSPYVEAAKERMRDGAIAHMAVPGDSISAEDLFDRIHSADGKDRPALLVRRINRRRLEFARQTGTDRDGTHYPDGEQYDYEQQAMKEYGISSSRDITYAAIYRPESGAIRVNLNDALLVYAPEALQQITPRYKDFSRVAVFGLHAFIDQRLVGSSLLATVESDRPLPQPAGFGEIALRQGLSFD